MGARPPRLLAAIAAALSVIGAVVAIGVQVAPAASAASACVDPPATPLASDVAGYWMLERSGSVHPFGAAARQAPDDNPGPSAAVAIASVGATGYRVLYGDGTVTAHGSAPAIADAATLALSGDDRAVALASTSTGRGYWVTTALGRVLAVGDAVHYGDMSAVALNGTIVAASATPSGHGYWLVGAEGGIFSFGDAAFYGSMGGRRLNAPIVAIVPDADGSGYWLVAADGGVFAFAASFRGSMGGARLNRPVVGAIGYGDGYLLVGADGGIFAFSNLPFLGSLGGSSQCDSITAVVSWPGRAPTTPTPIPTPAPAPAPVVPKPNPLPDSAGAGAKLGSLVVAANHDLSTYNRSDWSVWVDDDHDCQDTRAEVLITESRVPVTLTTDGCRVTNGEWLDEYTGTVFTVASQLDIDHAVPLANAHASGAWAWTAADRRAFGNDLSHPEALVAVSLSANRSKGDRSPDEWKPTNTADWCFYATHWVDVKARWSLTVTVTEHDALVAMLATCAGSGIAA